MVELLVDHWNQKALPPMTATFGVNEPSNLSMRVSILITV